MNDFAQKYIIQFLIPCWSNRRSGYYHFSHKYKKKFFLNTELRYITTVVCIRHDNHNNKFDSSPNILSF